MASVRDFFVHAAPPDRWRATVDMWIDHPSGGPKTFLGVGRLIDRNDLIDGWLTYDWITQNLDTGNVRAESLQEYLSRSPFGQYVRPFTIQSAYGTAAGDVILPDDGGPVVYYVTSVTRVSDGRRTERLRVFSSTGDDLLDEDHIKAIVAKEVSVP